MGPRGGQHGEANVDSMIGCGLAHAHNVCDVGTNEHNDSDKKSQHVGFFLHDIQYLSRINS